MAENRMGNGGKDKVLLFQKGTFTNPINLLIRASEDRPIGTFMKDAFAAYVLQAEKKQNYETLGTTFRDEDLDAVLRENPELYDLYQARINELIADPTKAQYGMTRGSDTSESDSAESGTAKAGLEYITGQKLVEMFQTDLKPLLGVENLPFVSTPTGRIYGLFSDITHVRNRFNLRFEAQDGREIACYSIDEMFRVKDDMREFVDKNNVVGISLVSNLGYDDSIITNDKVISGIRTQVAELARKKFRDYIVNG